jgi:hypothetical protein
MFLLKLLSRIVVGGLAAFAALLIFARLYAPWPDLTGEHTDELVIQLTQQKISDQGDSPVYVEIDGRDATPEQILELKKGIPPGIDVRPISEAPPLRPLPKDGVMFIGTRETHEFVKTSLMDMPLYRTAIVNVNVRGCFSRVAAVRALGRWRKVSDRWWCF